MPVWLPDRRRMSRPEDWSRVEEGVWEIVYRDESGRLHRHREFGDRQCVVCGSPVESRYWPHEECHWCVHGVARRRGLIRRRRG